MLIKQFLEKGLLAHLPLTSATGHLQGWEMMLCSSNYLSVKCQSFVGSEMWCVALIL